MAVTDAIFPKKYANTITRHEQKKIFYHATSVCNKQEQPVTDFVLSYTILCPLCHLHQRKHIKTKLTQLRIYFNVVCQVYTVEKGSYKTLTFDCSSPQYRGEMVYQTMHCLNKKS